MEVTEGVARYFARERGGARRHASPSARTGLDIYGGIALWGRLLRNDPALCCSRNTSAERQTTSDIAERQRLIAKAVPLFGYRQF